MAGIVESELVREAHHRVGNSLAILSALVKMKAIEIARSREHLAAREAQAVLDRIVAQIVAVSHVHRRLAATPDGGKTVDILDYLSDVCSTLLATLAPGAVLARGKSSPACPLVRIEVVQPVTLIVCEVMINALKHAHPSGAPLRMSLSCRPAEDGGIEIDVVDDGIGFPEDFDVDNSSGLGFRVIRMLARQAGAILSFRSSSLGTHFRLALPPRAVAPTEPV